MSRRRIQRGGTGGPDPTWNCQIINFCHVESFRQTPSGNLDPPEKIFWIRACKTEFQKKKKKKKKIYYTDD